MFCVYVLGSPPQHVFCTNEKRACEVRAHITNNVNRARVVECRREH